MPIRDTWLLTRFSMRLAWCVLRAICTTVFLLSSTLYAELPVPKIDGPTERQPGALTFLDASQSTGCNFAWLVDTSGVQVPQEASPNVADTVAQLRAMGFDVQEPEDESEPLWAVSDDGKRLWLSSYPGVYSIVLGVSNEDGNVLMPWKVVVKGTAPPPVVVPPPVIIPPPVVVPTDFASKVTAAVKANPAAHSGFGRVASTYETVADQIKSGLLTQPTQVKSLTNALTAAVSPEWAAIDAAVVQPHLTTLGLTTAAQHEGPWREIAKAVRAGLTDTPPPPPDVLPVTGLHVLIIEEMDDRTSLPAAQVSILTSTKLRDWFSANNVQWRQWDDDVDLAEVDQKWKDAMNRPRTSTPWIIASNGAAGYEGPLPSSVEATITLLEKYK